MPTSTVAPTNTLPSQPTTTPANTPIPLPPPPGQIVFLWNPEPVDPTGPQPQNLYFIAPGNVAGEWGLETTLTELHGADLHLSPDNTKFTLRQFEDTNEDGIISVQGTDLSNIYLYPLSDKALTRLTDVKTNDFVEVTWLPDSQQFTYAVEKDIYLFDLEDSASNKYLSLPGRIHDHQWSPDGYWLAIVSGLSDETGSAPGGESDRLDLYDVETNRVLTVISKLGGSRINWSPDSQWFAFSHDSSNLGLSVASINDLASIQLSSGLSFASWSPDGQWLAFTTQIGTGNLYLWNPDTLSTELLLEGYGRVSQPIWSPDSRYLAIALNAEEESNLLVVDVNNKTTSTLLIGPKPVPEPGPARWPLEMLSWSPDGQWILFEASGEDKRTFSIVNHTNGESFVVLDFTGTAAPENVYWLP
ncbi:MAG: hypothetical protein HND44_14055 [Chloroflexi bacterium]|nr:PD40 domain-containing protein [Ardenticatenaceae bacterium]NOG35680.1 hypothetical protein [Chloroflexota bacterium]